jgi:NADP-dependent 3-hydroxy acid dehydrogenase YdfG
MKRLDGQIAWIGGGASGMGEATAEFFAKEGAKVVGGRRRLHNPRSGKLLVKLNSRNRHEIQTCVC